MEVGRCPGCIQIHCHPDQDEVVTGERVNCGTGLVQIGVFDVVHIYIRRHVLVGLYMDAQ